MRYARTPTVSPATRATAAQCWSSSAQRAARVSGPRAKPCIRPCIVATKDRYVASPSLPRCKVTSPGTLARSSGARPRGENRVVGTAGGGAQARRRGNDGGDGGGARPPPPRARGVGGGGAGTGAAGALRRGGARGG